MYNAVDEKGIHDDMVVNDDGVGLNSDATKRSCAARQERVVCAGGVLVFIVIFGRDKSRSFNEDIKSVPKVPDAFLEPHKICNNSQKF